MIRKADNKDIPSLLELLKQVLRVHHDIRPDLFAAHGTKYTAEELAMLLADPSRPVFVHVDEDKVLGYVFCAFETHDGINETPHKTLYVDDLCVDRDARGQHVGRQLFEYAKAYAVREGCHNLTLHVWEGNDAARRFYEVMGLKPQYTSLELIVDA